MLTLVERAERFAVSAHESINQKRKYSLEPYHNHCRRVVNLLKRVTNDEEILAAAWLHDVLEDVAPNNPDYAEETILSTFGQRVYELVLALTDTPLSYGNRAHRKARDRERLQTADASTKTIKLADLIDNFIDIQENDPGYFKIYLSEIEQLVPCLREGNPILLSQLKNLIQLAKGK